MKITRSQLKKAIYLALYKTYVKALIQLTPGDGQTKYNWDIKFEGNTPIIYNAPTGDNILFTNEGVKPHLIKPKNSKALRWKNGPGDRFSFSKYVHHPGIEAMHYIEKVLENKALEQKARKILEQEIDKLIVKMKK